MGDLVLRQRYSTDHPAEASRAVREVFGAGTVSADPGGFQYDQRSLVDDGITVTRVASRGARVRLVNDGSPDLVVLAVGEGRMTLSCRGTELALGPEDLGLIPFNESCVLRWSEVRVDLYSFPLSSFVRTLGSPEGPPSVVAPHLTSRTAEFTALWHRLADLVTRQVLDREAVYSRDVIRAQMTDALTAVTVEAFGLINQHEDPPRRDEETIRRADTFMRAHLADPITVPDIAAAAGVSVRGLQIVLQRQLDTTPVSRLRRLRLEAARAALLNPAGDTTVGTVGRRVGYSNLGRFSAHYRAEYDESPSQTLASSRAS